MDAPRRLLLTVEARTRVWHELCWKGTEYGERWFQPITPNPTVSSNVVTMQLSTLSPSIAARNKKNGCNIFPLCFGLTGSRFGEQQGIRHSNWCTDAIVYFLSTSHRHLGVWWIGKARY